MKLKNKKTGEILEFDAILPVKDVAGDSVAHLEYYSLAKLNSEWEDAPEEPKEHYFITEYGGVFSLNEYEGLNNVANPEDYKEIGNYFETKEEAEKAVEKLKAWKRLKDNGFVFCGKGDCLDTIKFDYGSVGYNNQDFALLFGGEE